MKIVMSVAAFFTAILLAGSAVAQAPAVVHYAPVQTVAPTTVHYAPAVVAARPTTVAVQPARVVQRVPVAAPSAAPVAAPVATPVTTLSVPARPVSVFYSPYGGTEVRVPGQPVRNVLRAVVP